MVNIANHTYDEQVQTIQAQLEQCEQHLSLLAHLVFQQRWQSLAPALQAYQDAIAELKHIMHGRHELPTPLLHQFQHLSTEQRRVMRSIHQHMQQTSEDLLSLEQGISKLQQLAQHHEHISANQR